MQRGWRRNWVGGVAVAVTLGLGACEGGGGGFEEGACIASTDRGVEVVDCESSEAEQELVRFEGSTFDTTEPDCPEGTEVIGLRSPEGGAGQRWCVRDA